MTNQAPPPGPAPEPHPEPSQGLPTGYGTPAPYAGQSPYGSAPAYGYGQSLPDGRQLPFRGPVTPPAGLEYHRIHRGGAPGVWRPLVGVLSLASGMLVFAPLLLLALFVVGYVIAGEPLEESLTALTNTDDVTPMGLAFLSVSLAAAIPICGNWNQLPAGWMPARHPKKPPAEKR